MRPGGLRGNVLHISPNKLSTSLKGHGEKIPYKFPGNKNLIKKNSLIS